MTSSQKRPRPSPKPQKPSEPKKTTPPQQTRRSVHRNSTDKKVPEWVTTFLVVVITLVWVASFVAGLLNPKYQVPEQVNLLFSSMVGGLLLNAASKRRGGDGDE